MESKVSIIRRLATASRHPILFARWIRGRLRHYLLWPLWPLKLIFERGRLENAFVALFVPRKSQTSGEREDVLRMLLKLTPPDARVLEIGTYFGEGSTKVFIDGLSNEASFFVMDTWSEYISTTDKMCVPNKRFYRIMDGMSYFAATNTLRVILGAERRDDSPSITMIRRSSNDLFVADNFFDLVFIDGSHYYRDVRRDIELALRILKPGGIICGDDLEILPSTDLAAFAKQHPDEDAISGPEGDFFHPGVALAVYELLQTVEMKAGTWWKVTTK